MQITSRSGGWRGGHNDPECSRASPVARLRKLTARDTIATKSKERLRSRASKIRGGRPGRSPTSGSARLSGSRARSSTDLLATGGSRKSSIAGARVNGPYSASRELAVQARATAWFEQQLAIVHRSWRIPFEGRRQHSHLPAKHLVDRRGSCPDRHRGAELRHDDGREKFCARLTEWQTV